MKCIALRHVAFEDLGIFEDILKEGGYAIEYRQAGRQPLSSNEWRDTNLVVVLGGPISVYEHDKYPWLADEIDGVRLRLAANKPTLGICLGAQLMAAALGNKIYPGPKEIGWAKLTLTPEANTTPVRHLRNIHVLHWHGDTFDLPQGAIRLASTTVTPNQAFAVGASALALQFHAEVDGTTIEDWLIGHTCELAQANISVPDLRDATAEHGKTAAKAGRALLTNWLATLAPA